YPQIRVEPRWNRRPSLSTCKGAPRPGRAGVRRRSLGTSAASGSSPSRLVGSRARTTCGTSVRSASRSRMARAASASTTASMMRRRPWHLAHARTSTSNVRWRSCDHQHRRWHRGHAGRLQERARSPGVHSSDERHQLRFRRGRLGGGNRLWRCPFHSKRHGGRRLLSDRPACMRVLVLILAARSTCPQGV
ncbi:MAG: hypothetical protein K0S65_4918, partial [Labilithrix sp.]|nr:hypothetical protein [Labilithrix sp.]